MSRYLVPLVLLAALASPAVAASRPNVLFIVCDDLNTRIGCYGDPVVKTPNIDRLAARGVRFDRAYCQNPLCGPSRNSFLSGRRDDGQFPMTGHLRDVVPDVTFLPEHFRRNGYFTARVGKLFHTQSSFNATGPRNFEDPACWDVSETGAVATDPDGYGVVFASHPKGFPAHPELEDVAVDRELLNKAGGPAYDYWMEMAAVNLPDEQTVDGNIARRVAGLMAEKSKDASKPFFLAAGFRRPHLLWVAPKKYFDMYPPEGIQLPDQPADDLNDIPKLALTRGAPDMTDAQRRKAIASYFAMVSYVDAQLGVLLDAMDREKLWENTVVVFTSDHGWHLNEHGLWGKVSLFQESARVPLIIAGAGVTTRGEASPRTVELLDLYPTLAELAGLPAPEKLDGLSLVPQLNDPRAKRERPAFCVVRKGKQWGRSVYTETHRYAEWGEGGAGGVELYDVRADPNEYTNLSGDEQHAPVRAELKRLLDREAKLVEPPKRLGAAE